MKFFFIFIFPNFLSKHAISPFLVKVGSLQTSPWLTKFPHQKISLLWLLPSLINNILGTASVFYLNAQILIVKRYSAIGLLISLLGISQNAKNSCLDLATKIDKSFDMIEKTDSGLSLAETGLISIQFSLLTCAIRFRPLDFKN